MAAASAPGAVASALCRLHERQPRFGIDGGKDRLIQKVDKSPQPRALQQFADSRKFLCGVWPGCIETDRQTDRDRERET